MSGEDWQDVEMTLSTASAALRSEGPEFGPFWVSLSAKPPAIGRRPAERFLADQSAIIIKQQGAKTAQESREAGWAANLFGNSLQLGELQAQKVQPRPGKAAPTEGLSVAYKLRGRVSLPSRKDRQILQIAELDLKSRFYYVAAPVLTDYVYREAELTNDTQLALLAGPATVYLNGSFVGRTEIPMVAAGQKFTVGFGMDSQLRCGREMTEATERVLGANKVINRTYRLTLDNYKNKAVRIRLHDRIPYSRQDAAIRVTLGELADKLSVEPLYLERERPKGILRWDLEVPPKAAGATARKVEYSYTLEFDRKLHVVSPVGGKGAKELRAEFEAFQETAGKRKAR